MARAILWHNPACSKSRKALELLNGTDATITLREYLKQPPTLSELRELAKKLAVPAADFTRQTEPEWPLPAGASDAEVLETVVSQPGLLQRPILELHDAAVVGRPPEAVIDLLEARRGTNGRAG